MHGVEVEVDLATAGQVVSRRAKLTGKELSATNPACKDATAMPVTCGIGTDAFFRGNVQGNNRMYGK